MSTLFPLPEQLSPELWLETPLGQYLLGLEQAYLDKTVVDIFGYNALQVGFSQHDLLRASRMSYRATLDRSRGAQIVADRAELPIVSGSIDLLLLPHVLEFSPTPHQILREADRVLVPDGHLVLTCFNPVSLWGLRQALFRADGFPWQGRFISLMRLKDWLALLGFELVGGSMGCYVPPCRSAKWLGRWEFMESAGDRWWPFSGALIYLHAQKRVRGMRVITPRWAQRAPSQSLVSVSQKQPVVSVGGIGCEAAKTECR